MKRNTGLSEIILCVNTIAMFVFSVPLVAAIFFNASDFLLCISIFLILIEIEFLILGFIPIWKLLVLSKRNITNQQIKLSSFLISLPFILIGIYVTGCSASNFYQEIGAVFKDYRAGIFTYQEEFPVWMTYNKDTNPAEFTAEIILRCFITGLWGLLLEFGILIITVPSVFIIRPDFRKN
ncbi:hypothetical protein [Chryseobacterium sp. X308]|uniref:hypothetical protein n=1 Tax=Chryseobacterium sp. X308 TaxID=2884873 RepID=UPI001D156FCF|nr:hypothetical protein [Chryseobacterium sp. X308]